MPPKRRSAASGAPKSNQSTLAFHGTSNKVTKPGTRAQSAKKNALSEKPNKEIEKAVIDLVSGDDSQPTSAEVAILDQTAKEAVAQQTQSTPEEDEARRITAARIKKYWTAKEKERKAPRMHQKDLSVHEKILREFDMSGQYGPSTGIARLKRWKRAHRLDLNPPIEVLAVLLKEQDGSDKLAMQRSRVDELLNSHAEELGV
ncbi:hypothetical protein BS50DRAFT_578025 [Corynespora cassiicola Philippines]|uniref:DNA polymerase delta subunit 4 n=1 Tax=Corynespora cassiicola Philippines TaxID=1448308 RepID=A0A2T2N9X7_CORCC|nr:hypothetical protein BS50DRAFT_578025 [Corynespora cassiicola Philippines]